MIYKLHGSSSGWRQLEISHAYVCACLLTVMPQYSLYASLARTRGETISVPGLPSVKVLSPCETITCLRLVVFLVLRNIADPATSRTVLEPSK